MTRLEKIQLAIEKGITCDVETGKVYGVRGNELTYKTNKGYKQFALKTNKNVYKLFQHQLIYYVSTGEIVEQIDHINGDKSDNRIINLRGVTQNENQQNRKTSKGYYKRYNKWTSRITFDKKVVYLGHFDTELEARQAYLDAKKIYHII